MTDLSHVRVLAHSAIRIEGEKTVYVDPFHLKEAPQDGDLILVTHDHYDHFSPEDIRKAARKDAVLVIPASLKETALQAGFPEARILTMGPWENRTVLGVSVETVPAYNLGKPFHRPEKRWLGYVVTLGGIRYYVAGDTDENEDNRRVRCDVALVPVGGTYTMTADEAAVFVNHLKPKAAVPTHYGDIVGSEEDAAHFCRLLDPEIGSELCRG